MTEKVNKKYSNLNEEQKDVIRLYVFSKDDTQVKESLVEKLSGIKNKFLAVLPAHRHEFVNDKVLIDKLSEVKNTLLKEYSDFSSVNDDMVGFYLGLSKLEHEVKSK
jgi:septation ring formation regulator EzrA